MKYSIIIPVYNRPEEANELLESLSKQTFRDFEVIVVEDGSSTPCKEVCEKYEGKMPLHYLWKENGGPAPARNFGAEEAQGEFLIILDSDCVLPESYMEEVDKELAQKDSDAFGGPDRAHSSFSTTQKAINYAMTSFFTTGGIRGGKKKLDKFYPRSFNMGIRRSVYKNLGGFSRMRFGEDIDLSIRIFEGNYSCRLFPEAWVWHKRRTDLKKFFKQVHNSGIARINLWKRHPGSLKIVHLLPAVFTLGVALLLILFLIGLGTFCFSTDASSKDCGTTIMGISLLPIIFYSLLILMDASLKEHSLIVGFKSIIASFVQLTGYGSGFLRAFVSRCILGRGEFEAFKKNFYK